MDPITWFFKELLGFWGMLAIIVIQLCALIVIILVMGEEGRFFLKLRMVPGSRTILLKGSHTNQYKFYRAEDDGRALKYKKRLFMFLPGFVRNFGQIEDATEEQEEDFNELIKMTGSIGGYRFYIGSAPVSFAVGPSFIETLEGLELGSEKLKGFLKELKTKLKDTKYRIVELLMPFNIHELTQILNTVVTEHRQEIIFAQGEQHGRNMHKVRENALILVIAGLMICVLALVFMVLRKG